MDTLKALCLAGAVGCAASLFAAEWTYDNSTKRMTTADGWSIKISSVSANNVLSTPGNSGFIAAAPETGDREDGTYTLDLAGTITDSADPSITYTLGAIGYYAFNSCPVAVSKVIFPDTVTTWSLGSAVGLFGRCNSSYMDVVPRNFLSGVTLSGGGFSLGLNNFNGELHLKGATGVGGLTLQNGTLLKVFLYPLCASIGRTAFANRSGNSRYDLYFMQGTAVPSGIDDTSYGTGNYAYLNIPSGETSWETWLESNAREFTDSDLETFQTRFPDKATPQYVITAGKFNNAYAAFWNGAPGVSVVSMGGVAADEIVPAQGTFEKPRTDDPIQFSAPAECDGYTCAGYTLEVTSTDWDAAVKTTVEDVTSFELDIDTGKKYRVTWLWASDAANSVTVSSNMGAEFGSCSPAYGIYTDFPDGAMTFTAPNPAYDDSVGYRYRVQGYKLTDADGNETIGTGTEFVYNTEMGVVILEWQWVLDGYRLNCIGDGYLDIESNVTMDSNGYLPINSIASLTAVDGPEGEFYHWAGETTGIDSYSRTITIEMTSPRTLVATPKCKWYFVEGSSYMTNVIGWKVGVGKISGSSNLYLGGDCVKTMATVPWSSDRYLGKEVHLLDLSLPVVSDTTGEPFYITKINSYCFRRQTAGYLAKLIMPETWNEIGDMGYGTAIFTSQDYLEEITPVFFPKDIVGPNQYPSFGGIKYSGDICLEAGCFLGIGSNCSISFRHGKTQNIYFGTNFVTLGTSATIFTHSQANYVLWFKNCPAAFPSSRNASGNYSFYVRYPSGNSEWSEYLSLNARKFEESDESNFAARFPEAAAAGLWPKMTFTNGFFNGTWARVNGNAGSAIFVK